jgi:hypothetical protein
MLGLRNSKHALGEAVSMLRAVIEPPVRARALARLLTRGLASPREVVAWVDTLIAQAPFPHEALIEAALSETRRGDLISALNRFADVSGVDDGPVVWTAILRELGGWLRDHPDDGPRIADVLYGMAVDGEYPDAEAEGEMYQLDDEYELAATGVHRSRPEVDRQLREFLGRYAA